MKVLKWIAGQFMDLWCIIVHGLIQDKHKMHKAYAPMICEKCGRGWVL